jgi:hypothetical protein
MCQDLEDCRHENERAGQEERENPVNQRKPSSLSVRELKSRVLPQTTLSGHEEKHGHRCSFNQQLIHLERLLLTEFENLFLLMKQHHIALSPRSIRLPGRCGGHSARAEHPPFRSGTPFPLTILLVDPGSGANFAASALHFLPGGSTPSRMR